MHSPFSPTPAARASAMLPTARPFALFLALALAAATSPALGEETASPAASSADAVPPAGGPADKDAWDKVLEGLLAKEGISMGGMFRSQYLHSSIGGPGSTGTRRSEESLEYTSVDFDVRARPNTLTQGRLVFRMHQDWRNFFSDIGNPVNARWISIDGRAKDMFSYNVGDYRAEWSPLTLHAPDLELLHEPEIFAAQRREAMAEHFLGGGDRLLQGVNMALDAGLEGSSGPTFLRELHLDLMGSRLRNVETSVQNGNKVTSFVERSLTEKFLGAGNADLVLPAGISLGGTHMRIFDKKGSYAGPNQDTAAQHTSIWAARGGFDAAKALGWKDGSLSLSAEYATSADDTVSFLGSSTDTTRKASIDGSALLARVRGGWKTAGNRFGFRLGVDWHHNEADYRNELAQSPTFLGERILNIENDTGATRFNDIRAPYYSTFDAMYRHVFKFAPLENTNNWQKAPFSKNSYTNNILTQSEMAASAARLDPAVQLLMPFGPATPNRAGIRADLTLSAWEDMVEIHGLASFLDEIEGMRIDSARALPKTAFTQAGGGLKLEVGGMFGMTYPLTLSGSLVRSAAENAGMGDTLLPATRIESDFLNAGGRWKFWKRASLLAGYQRIRTARSGAANSPKDEQVQENLAGGAEYKVADGASVTFAVNRIKVDPGSGPEDREFSQLQTDLYLTVRF